MKKTIIYAILFAMSIMAMMQIINNVTNTHSNGVYAMTCKVVEVDHENDLVTLVDANGFEWTWEHTEDWQVGDCTALVMDDNGTPYIFDDIILSMQYNAWSLV